MKQLLKFGEGRGCLEVKNVAIKPPSIKEVLIKVKTAAICGTDVHIFEWNKWAEEKYKSSLPLPLGHEFCGEVVEVGSFVENFKPGDRVTVETHLSCGKCFYCRQGKPHICANLVLFSQSKAGCFSEYTTVPEGFLVKVPEGLSNEEGSLLEPFGVSVRAVTASHTTDRSLLIQGCGPIGLFAIPVARALGVSNIYAVEANPYRISLAKKMGADLVLNPQKGNVFESILELTCGVGVSSIIDFTGNITAIQNGFQYIQKAGIYVFVGLPSKKAEINISNDIVTREITMTGCYGRLLPETWLLSEKLLLSGKINILEAVTHKFPLEDFEEAFNLCESKDCGKILFKEPLNKN